MSNYANRSGRRIDPDGYRLDRLCDEFERRWSSGETPRIEDVLGDATANLKGLFDELLRLELEFRRQHGEQPELAEYLQRFPQQESIVRTAFGDVAASTLASPEEDSSIALPELPGYMLLGELGRGGMGVVYKARQIQLNRLVAIKTIRAGELASPEEIKRFLAEAEAAAKLNHPHIVPIHEIGEQAGLHFFSMGFVDGPSVKERLAAEGIIEPKEAARLVATLAEAVHYAHQRGVVHRDLKPANVLLQVESGEPNVESPTSEIVPPKSSRNAQPSTLHPRITDFGLAKRIDADSSMTATGQVLGTPSFMPPEQASGDADRVGPRSDVYSLGAILYALVTGRPPFQAANVIETLKQVLESEPVSPRQLNPSVDRDLETICLKCLEKEPDKRYATARDLADDLGRYLRNEPISARPVGRLERGWRWCRRNPAQALAGLALVVAISASVGFGIRYSYSQQLEDALDRATVAKQEAEIAQNGEKTQRIKAQAAEAKANAAQAMTARLNDELDQLLYVRQISAIKDAWDSNDVLLARRLLKKCSPQRRGWEWHYAHQMCHPELREFEGQKGYFSAVSYSPNGKRIVAAGHRQLSIWDSDNGKRLADIPTAIPVGCISYAPDSRRFVTVGTRRSLRGLGFQGSLVIRAADTGRPLRTLRGHVGYLQGVAWSHDGKWIASCGSTWDGGKGDKRSEIKLWSVSTGECHRTFASKDGHSHSVAFSPDSRHLVSRGDGVLRLWDVSSGKELAATKKSKVNHLTHTCGPYFTPDGKRLIACSTIGYLGKRVCLIWIWDAKTLRHILNRALGFFTANCLALSPDGEQFAIGDNMAQVRLFALKSYREQLRLKGNLRPFSGIAFSPNRQRFVTAGSTIKEWHTVVRTDLRPLVRSPFGSDKVALSSDGRKLVADILGKVYVFDADSAKILRTVVSKRSGSVSISALSSDGKWLLTNGRRIAKKTRKSVYTLSLWNVETGRSVFVKQFHSSVSAAVSSDGKWVMTTVAERVPQSKQRKTRLEIWDITDGRKVVSKVYGDDQRVTTQIAMTRGGNTFVVGHLDGRVSLWTPGQPQRVDEITAHKGPVLEVASGPKSDVIVSAGRSRPGRDAGRIEVCAWNGKTRLQVATMEEADKCYGMKHVVLSPGGKLLACADNTAQLRLWNVNTGQLIMQHDLSPESGGFIGDISHAISSVAFSPNNRRLFVGGITTNTTRESLTAKLTIWDTKYARQVMSIEPQGWCVRHVVVFPDGKRVITESEDQSVFPPVFRLQVWDARSGLWPDDKPAKK